MPLHQRLLPWWEIRTAYSNTKVSHAQLHPELLSWLWHHAAATSTITLIFLGAYAHSHTAHCVHKASFSIVFDVFYTALLSIPQAAMCQYTITSRSTCPRSQPPATWHDSLQGQYTCPNGISLQSQPVNQYNKKPATHGTHAMLARLLRAGDTAYAAEGIKRRKTAAEAASGAVLDPQGRWTVAQRQPWADKTVEPARPTAEQMEWLEQEGFLKDEKDKKQEVRRSACWRNRLPLDMATLCVSRRAAVRRGLSQGMLGMAGRHAACSL